MGVGPAKFPRPDATPERERMSRAEAKLRELEKARRAGTISDQDFEDQKARLLAENPDAEG